MGIQPEIPSERVAVITFLLAKGARLRISEIAALCSIKERGARSLTERISRVVPFVRVDGEWVECSAADETAQDVPPTVLQ